MSAPCAFSEFLAPPTRLAVTEHQLKSLRPQGFRPRLRVAAGSLAILALTLTGCFNSNQPSAAEVSGLGSGVLQLKKIEWGRLVDVVDQDGTLFETDVLVRHDLSIDGINYELSTNPVTQAETLTVLKTIGSPAFEALLSAAQGGLENVIKKGPLDPPNYSLVARNAAVRLEFTELVDRNTVNANTVQVLWGDPASLQLTVRYVVKNDRTTGKGFIILDPTISARQSASLGLPENAIGFPESFDSINDNLKIRIPTQRDVLFGQPQVLTNMNGTRNLTAAAGEPIEFSAGGDPVVVRVARTGNDKDVFNGFMQDLTRPDLVGVQDVTVTNIVAPNGTEDPVREITYSVNAAYCADMTPKEGDVFEFFGAVLSVSAVLSSGNPAAYEVRGNLLEGDLFPGSVMLTARLNTIYEATDANIQLCYLTFSPTPVTGPGQLMELDPQSTVTARFSEPIDPLTMTSMGTFVVTAFELTDSFGLDAVHYRHPSFATETVPDYIERQRGYHLVVNNAGTDPISERGGRVMFGPIEPDTSSRTFTLSPVAGFSEPNEDPFLQFSVALRNGPDGVRDLAGNPLNFSGFVAGAPLPSVPVESQISVQGGGGLTAALRSKYFCLRGNGIDENLDGLPEYGGQFGYDDGRITGRAPDRLLADADSSNEYIGAQQTVPNPNTAQAPYAPLVPAGSVVMTTYRPHDFGFGYLNPQEYDLDVAGLSWAPLGGVVFDDTFARYSLALAHSKFHPDEVLNPLTQAPIYPGSGLNITGNYDENILGFPEFDEKIVFDTTYTMRAIDLFPAQSNVTMLPWPIFQDTYTWRDTTIPPTVVGGQPQSVGSPPLQYSIVSGIGTIWAPEQVPSIGLPLLARFRCYPRGEFLGTNQFQTTQMVFTSQLPAFRIFSAGGRDASGIWQQVIPDNAASGGTEPSGGFNIQSGQPTGAFDTLVYWAEADFVVRVSRVFTHWFDMSSPLAADGTDGVILEPDNAIQNVGTSVVVEFRGAVQVDHNGDPLLNPGPLTDSSAFFDNFGEYTIPGVSTPSEWTTDFAELENQNYRFFQVRMTFVSNVDGGLQAFMDGLGVAWKL